MARIAFDPTTANHSTAIYTPGQVYEWGAKKYMYCQNINSGSTAAAAGDVAVLANANGYGVISPGNGTGLTNSPVVGVWAGAVTKNYYGWVQVYGICTNAKCAAGVAVGDVLGADTTNQRFAVLSYSGPSSAQVKAGDVVGGQIIALTAHSSGTCTVRLRGM